MDKIYFENFTCIEDIKSNFCISDKDLQDVIIIYAAYDTPDYEGYAHIIFIKEGTVYEVNGSHCSCAGLEGQWEPEETSVIALLTRPNVSGDAKANLKSYFKNLLCFL
jgi:hypothetical protein